MKKKNISPLCNLVDLVLGSAILLCIALAFSKCSNTTQAQPSTDLVEMQSYHANKGILSEQDGLLTIYKN